MIREKTRPTPEEWQARLPTLKSVGSQLQGPCPACGGEDRFHVALALPHYFGCRKCDDGPAILRVVFGSEEGSEQVKPSRPAWRPNSDFLIAEYHRPDGRATQVYRKDWPVDWSGHPCNWPDCKEAGPHKHVWRGKGQPRRDLLLLLWHPEEPIDRDLVVICEGEKAAAAVQRAGYIGASYCGGVPAGVKYADFSPVTDMPVLVWPDADKAGIKAGDVAVEKAHAVRALDVRLVEVQAGAGEDAADYSIEDIRRKVTEALALEALVPGDVGAGIQGPPLKSEQYIQLDEHGLRAVLTYLNLEVRENPRNLQTEIRRTGTPAAAKAWASQWSGQWSGDYQPGYWIAMTDAIDASLLQTSQEYFVSFSADGRSAPALFSERDYKRAMLNNCPRPAIDPFRLWLEDLPAWDGVNRTCRLWIDTLAMPDTELTREAGRRILIGAVRRSYEPGCVHNWIPVLVGPQGLGKSSVVKELVSVCEVWYSDGTQLDGTPQERNETTGPAVINEFSEMAGLGRAESSAFKGWIQRTVDRFRSAYGRHSQSTPRRWVGVGTANEDPEGVLPGDSTGKRRYVVLISEFQGTDNELAAWAHQARAWVRDRLQQLWAEALHDYHQATKVKDREEREGMNLIPGHLRSAQELAAEGLDRHFEGLREIAVKLIPWGQDYERAHGVGPTINELMVEGDLAETEGDAAKDRGTQTSLGKELTAAHWGKKQKMLYGVSGRRWYAPLPEGEALVQIAAGKCLEKLPDGNECGNPTRNEKVTRCDECTNRHLGPPRESESLGESPSQGPIEGALQVRIAAIDLQLQEMRSEGVSYAEALELTRKGENGLQAMGPADPQAYNLLRVKRNALQALRAAKPDKVAASELLELWGGAAGVVAFIESHIDETPWVVWDSFDWIPILRDASALVQEQVKREQQVVRQQIQERLRQRLLQWPLPQVEGSPA